MDKFIWGRRSVLQNKVKKIDNLFCVSLFVLFFLIYFSGCKSNEKQGLPYMIDGKIDMKNENSTVCSVELNFYNKSEKIVNEFTVVFYIFDSEGELISSNKNNIVLSIKQNISSNESYECLVNVDDYFSSNQDDEYFLDYLYVSQIKYSDGSEWQDSFGLKAF